MTNDGKTARLTNTDLRGGPYVAPSVQSGDWLDDAIVGAVQVSAWSDGRIPWPCREKAGRHRLILCGDLIEAVRAESMEAIQYHFGAGRWTVEKWCRALGVVHKTPLQDLPYAHLLGAVPDREIAKRYKLSVNSVRVARRHRGLAPARPENPDSTRRARASYFDLLGILPDREIAERYEINVSAVARARKRRGIAPVTPKELPYRHLLGVEPDKKIAEKYGVTPSAVFTARDRRGIAPALGKSTRQKEYEHLLGVEPDAKIARELGVSVGAIFRARYLRGITAAPRPGSRLKKLPYEHLLGAMSDKVIAEQYGITAQSVCHARKERSIAPAPKMEINLTSLCYPARFEAQAEGGFFVQFVDFADTFTEGKTEKEALFNAVEVLSAMLDMKLV